jgi:CAAX prenyl protease-like protein
MEHDFSAGKALRMSPERDKGWHELAAYVLPFALFIAGTALEGLEAVKPWYSLAYLCKISLVLGALLGGRSYYPSWNTQGLLWGLLAGLIGGVLWIILCTWNVESLIVPYLPGWAQPGPRTGGNPLIDPWLGGLFVAVRLLGLVIVVPWMEEVFWRGFLNRFLIHENWQTVPLGKFTPMSFAVVTLLFVAVHPEWTAALVWGIGINLVLMWTRNIWACVATHAGSNAVLGFYILTYEQWQLW